MGLSGTLETDPIPHGQGLELGIGGWISEMGDLGFGDWVWVLGYLGFLEMNMGSGGGEGGGSGGGRGDSGVEALS
ncbi:hypothetical protein GBA52_003031 [Prunus armeniaca]|nr:hypothetical protein GBA52_003031 [Prunus armeniaca]